MATMTLCPSFPPNGPRVVEIVVFPAVQVLDVTGPLQVFASANVFSAETGAAQPPYVVRVVARSQLVVCSAGLGLVAEILPLASEPIDTLVVAGGEGVDAAAVDPTLVTWVQGRAARARRTTSVCTGAFILASAGLLDGRCVATHWSRCAELARRYPAVQVEADPIFIQDGSTWTSAGVTAGIDLALALVEQDIGRAMAMRIARDLVVFFKRPGDQAQFSAAMMLQDAGGRLPCSARLDWRESGPQLAPLRTGATGRNE